MKKKKYILPETKVISLELTEIMTDSKLNSSEGDQTVTPTTDEEFDGEFGGKGNFWD